MVASAPTRLKEQLERWRSDLINLTKRNKLLYFKHTKSSSLEITKPSMETVFARLDGPDNARFLEFHSVDATIDDQQDNKRDEIIAESTRTLTKTEVLTNKLFSDELLPVLRNLDRRSREQFVDTGLWTLYVAFGFLQWEDPSDKQLIESPLLLVPVELAKSGQQARFRLQRTQEDAAVNPALAEKLEQSFGIKLPNIDTFDEVTPALVMDYVSKLITRQKNWSLQEKSVLALFSFQKESIYQDLGQNMKSIIDHPMIQLLGLGPDSEVEEFAFNQPTEFEIDAVIPPEEMLTILDADSTQRKCIIAARDGKSFVMDGPPGTGKSQTISNIIAELIGSGKTVLFVSEKAAALDVVYKRLREAGLHEFVLNLHSHETSRKAVATELGRALMTRPRASSAKVLDIPKLRNARKKLSNYSDALNEIRDDLGKSLHDVIGRVSQLSQFPSLDTSDVEEIGAFDIDRLNAVLQEVELLSTVWHPISDPETFYWKHLVDSSATQSRIISSRQRLTSALEKLDIVKNAAQTLSADLNLGDISTFTDFEKYMKILVLLDDRPEIPPTGILAEQSFDESYLQEMQQLFNERARIEAFLIAGLGTSWKKLPAADIRETNRFFDTLQAVAPLIIGVTSSKSENFQTATRILQNICSELAQLKTLIDRIFLDLGIQKDSASFNEAQVLFEILESIAEQAEISESWLNQPSIDRIRSLFNNVRDTTDEVNSKYEELQSTFKESIVTEDAINLLRRFTEVHRGLRSFSKQARLDRQKLKFHSPINKYQKNSIQLLEKVIRLQDALKRMEQATSDAQVLLGPHLDGRETNFDRISRSIDLTEFLIRNDRRTLLSPKVRSLIIGQLGIPSSLLSEFIALSEALSRTVDLFMQIQPEEFEKMRMTPLVDLSKKLDVQAQISTGFFRIATTCDSINNIEKNWSDLVGLATAHQKASELDSAIEIQDPKLHLIFEPHYQRFDSNWVEIIKIGKWILSFNKLASVISESHADKLLKTDWTSNAVSQILKDWQICAELVADEFKKVYRAEVVQSFSSQIDDAKASLEARLQNTSQIIVWSDFQRVTSNLKKMGLTNFVKSLLNIRDESSLSKSAEKSLLELWVDKIVNEDKRVSPLHAIDRDNLVNLFARLDKDLVDSSASKIINFCSQRRPTSNIGAAAIIQRQSQLSRKHKPTKELLKETNSITKLLKPCFMMSPLSVSRYLPADMAFDAVIFDEASQVKPADAINSIYRGAQLIVSGDQKQLPPTSFFDSAFNTDETTEDQYDEFESILDLCKSTGGLESLPLQWHYRSQHEDLITFSNYRFYDGSLKTFPSAQQDSADLGVELFHVPNGRYRRGGQRDNPIEAEAVVDRVLFHKKNHPNLSIGVVAFSTAQQDTIRAALENRARTAPELNDFIVSGDRLDGFFVKNLENVQGDDRDIIIFSIGYGPDEVGKITMNFGPMNGPSGNRRLNVAITRAKRRVEIITSIRAEQFSSGITGGVKNLRDYLKFAEDGISALFQGSLQSEGDSESPFEAEIANVIRSMGYDVVPQVGAAGYRIDIGVVHPDNPSRYLLGVEADGATYHRTFVARDRDRLRQAVLEGLGWRFHRIWSTAWFRDRSNEEIRLREALDAARSGNPVAPTETNRHQKVEIIIDEISIDDTPPWVTEYQCTRLQNKSFKFDFLDPKATREIASVIKTIIDTEGPVHEDRVLRLIRESYGIGRTGAAIRDSFDNALLAVLRDDYSKKDGFISVNGKNLSSVRCPDPRVADSIRSISEIPPGEIDLAVINLLHDAMKTTVDELTVRISRLFGWARTGVEISAAVARSINRLNRGGHLTKTGTQLSIK